MTQTWQTFLFCCKNRFFFMDILMVLKNPRFKICKRIYTIDFPLSLEIKSLSILSQLHWIVNKLKMSFIYFDWCDLCILWQWTSLKLSGHIRFVLCKKYQPKLQFGTLNQTYLKSWFWETEKNLWCRFSQRSLNLNFSRPSKYPKSDTNPRCTKWSW